MGAHLVGQSRFFVSRGKRNGWAWGVVAAVLISGGSCIRCVLALLVQARRVSLAHARATVPSARIAESARGARETRCLVLLVLRPWACSVLWLTGGWAGVASLLGLRHARARHALGPAFLRGDIPAAALVVSQKRRHSLAGAAAVGSRSASPRALVG
jgi:hypothetical protein